MEQHLYLNPTALERADNVAAASTVLDGMLAGADSIEDLNDLRAGGAPEMLDDVRAPSTIVTWLRAFTRGNAANSTP